MKLLNTEKIKELIEAKGWPQNELARRAGISKQTLSDILRNRNPNVRNLTRIAEALDVNETEILEIVPDEESDHLAFAM